MESQARPLTLDSLPVPQEQGASVLLWRRFHRHMHGRYPIAIAIGFAAALAGSTFAYRYFVPTFKSTGVLQITPLTLKVLLAQNDVSSPVFDNFVDVQISFIRSRPVIAAVLNDPKWLETHPGDGPMEPDAFLRGLDIVHPVHSETIEISYTDRTALGAKTAVNLLMESYMRINGNQSGNQRIKAMQERSDQLNKELAAFNAQMSEMAKKNGPDDLKQLHQAKNSELGRLETMMMDTEINLALAESALGKSDAFSSLPPSELAATDDSLRRLLEEAQHTEEKLTEHLLTRGKDHPDVVAVRTKLDSLKRDIKLRSEVIQKYHQTGAAGKAGVLEGPPTQASIDALKLRLENLRGLYKTAQQRSLEIGGQSFEFTNLQEQQKKVRDQLTENQTKLDQMRVDTSIIGQIVVLTPGELPTRPARDQRRNMALAAAMGCFGLGFCLISAWSFTDRRLRRPADVAGAGLDVPILGTFPRVAAGKPAQALLAGAALHQTMTVLQIDPQLSAIRVFAVSSASQNEGKTDMAAALAVGFGILGKRTLLVDFDHRTCALTRFLVSPNKFADKNKAIKGLFDVLAGEKVANCCRSTPQPRVSLLPMGGNAIGRIGSLTSAQIRAVLAEAAAEFEIVLLDIPPILDGLESTLICKEVESLLLAVTPKTSDQVLHKAITNLRSAGASVGGLLFNQAASADLNPAALASEEDLRPFLPGRNGMFVEALWKP
jgi:succinoglycan biosynthesis transport protein ExoP